MVGDDLAALNPEHDTARDKRPAQGPFFIWRLGARHAGFMLIQRSSIVGHRVRH
jgi:hypothetical protein